MLKIFSRNRGGDRAPLQVASAPQLAGELFDQGFSCARATLQATTGTTSSELLAATDGFACGIGKSGCLCGAVTGAVMALGILGHGKHSGELVTAFKEQFSTTCCRALSRDYRWNSREHRNNCRRITVAATEMATAISRR